MTKTPLNIPQLIAHRGASAEAPENTLSAIRQAIALDVDWVEIDIHLSKDGIPIVIHDRLIPEAVVGGKKIAVDSLTLQEIKQIDCGTWFSPAFANERIPTLQEVLAEPFQKVGLMIEVKHENEPADKIVHAIVEVLNTFPSLPSIKIGSFSIEILKEVQKQAPNLALIGIIEEPEMIPEFLAHQISLLAIWHELLTPKDIALLLARNLTIWTFTVDSFSQAEQLLSEGIKGIITNRSRELLKLFKKQKSIA